MKRFIMKYKMYVYSYFQFMYVYLKLFNGLKYGEFLQWGYVFYDQIRKMFNIIEDCLKECVCSFWFLLYGQ